VYLQVYRQALVSLQEPNLLQRTTIIGSAKPAPIMLDQIEVEKAVQYNLTDKLFPLSTCLNIGDYPQLSRGYLLSAMCKEGTTTLFQLSFWNVL
jgi:hypothetical protein